MLTGAARRLLDDIGLGENRARVVSPGPAATVFDVVQEADGPRSGLNRRDTLPGSAVGRRLVFWDVDHTLPDTGGVGRELYELAFCAATGHPFRVRAKITGRTELAILADTLALHDLPQTAAVVGSYSEELVRQYESHGDALRARGRALAGAREAVSALSEEGFTQTVVTGNLRGVTAVKLGVYDLQQHLDLAVGAYAEDGTERADLVRVALQRCCAAYGAAAACAVLIGDTPSDMQAAVDHGVPAVGVATGRADAATLLGAGAATVLDDLEDTGSVIAAVKRFTSIR